jgi:hypothetical protein
VTGGRTLAAVATLAALALCCGTGSRVHPSGHLSTPTQHVASEPAACTPRQAVDCPQSFTTGCKLDSECTAGLNGRCQYTNQACECTYDACATNADCPAGTDCMCEPMSGGAGFTGSPTQCLPSNCRTDADCGPGGFCSPSQLNGTLWSCGAIVGNFCHTTNDECGVDADCLVDPGVALYPACVYSVERGHWVCAAFASCD